MPNFEKYKKLGIGFGRSIPLKLLEYIRNQLRSKKFNQGLGKKIQLIDFINNIALASEVKVTDEAYQFQKQIAASNLAFIIRKKSSDIFVYNQVIEMEEYRFLVDFIENKQAEYTFLDVGANVGLTTLYLKAHFPNARIFCFEPEPTNFSALKMHIETNQLPNINLFNKGLFIKDGCLYADRSFRDGELWSFRLNEKGDDANKMDVISISSVITNHDIALIDFLKIDIEGGEFALLKDETFLKVIGEKVKLVMMEIHPEVISYHEAKEILRGAGFVVFDIAGSSVGINKKLNN